MGNAICGNLVIGVFFVTSLVFMLSELKDWITYYASKDWLPVTGQVTLSKVNINYGKRGSAYRTEIWYSYEVGGQNYKGKRFGFGSDVANYVTPREADDVIARYPVGGQTTVYYNPNNPSQAVLERKHDATAAIVSVVTFLLLTCFAILFVGLRTLGYLK